MRAVIERVRPDAVVLELDQERLDGVVATAMHAETDRPEPASDRPNPSAEPDRDRGVDRDVPSSWPSFPYALAAPPAGYGAPISLSGAVAREAAGGRSSSWATRRRVRSRNTSARVSSTHPRSSRMFPRLWRSFAHLSRALGLDARERRPPVVGADGPAATVRFSDVVAEDPGKLIPLRGPFTVGALALATTLGDALGIGIAPGDGIAVPVPVPVPVPSPDGWTRRRPRRPRRRPRRPCWRSAARPRYSSRTAMLRCARSAARAVAVSAALRRGHLRRLSFPFTPDADVTAARARAAGPPGVPCFTTRRPLLADETRRLNLFEPRWLALMDRLAEENGGELVGAELGCVLGVNRRYVSDEWLGRATASSTSSPSSSTTRIAAAGDRSADLVVEPWMRRARVTRVAEGRRAVTGARKLEVWIEGAATANRGGSSRTWRG